MSRMIRLAVTLGGLFVAGLLYRLLSSIDVDRWFNRLTCVALLVVGVVLLLWIAPLIPLLIITFSVVQFVRLSIIRAAIEKHAEVDQSRF